jgi:hypothetical protein
MEAGKFSFKFSRQTQKNLVGSSKYAYFNNTVKAYKSALSLQGIFPQALSEQDIFLQTLS